jgi:histidinol-phosphate aminotransferase
MNGWRENVRGVTPYVPGEQPDEPDMVKLNTNENPYPPAPGVQAALEDAGADSLRLYPDPAASELVEALAERYQVKPSQVFVGVGSDDVLAMAFLTFFNSDKPVLFPDITYSFYDVWADLFRIPFHQVPLDGHFRIVPEDYLADNGGIIFPNPNAPTGVALPLEAVEKIVRGNPDSVVIVDEAYVDFGTESALPLVEKYDNLLVVQTFSKSRSLAGMRIGFCIGNEELIACLNNVKYSFNSYTMSRLALKLGTASVKDEVYFRETTARIVETREWAKKEFAELGFVFEDSLANFIFAAHRTVPAKQIYQALREAHIYVRYFDRPRTSNYLRITVGTPEQMKKLFAFLKKILPAFSEKG